MSSNGVEIEITASCPLLCKESTELTPSGCLESGSSQVSCIIKVPE